MCGLPVVYLSIFLRQTYFFFASNWSSWGYGHLNDAQNGKVGSWRTVVFFHTWRPWSWHTLPDTNDSNGRVFAIFKCLFLTKSDHKKKKHWEPLWASPSTTLSVEGLTRPELTWSWVNWKGTKKVRKAEFVTVSEAYDIIWPSEANKAMIWPSEAC